MRRAFVPLAALALVSVAFACGDGQQANNGLNEPIQVLGAQFIAGDLPGTLPVDGGTTPADGGPAPPPAPLSVLEVDYSDLTIIPGQANKPLGGLVTSDAVAVGVRLADLGTGYWVVPVGGRDGTTPTASDFSFGANFPLSDPPGNHPLRIVAIDAQGNAGTQVDTPFCIESRVPDNMHACNPKRPVPAVVFSLQWDTNFDVDLHVITPDGRDINPKTDPLGVTVDAGQPPADAPKIDRDSLGQCVPDGFRQEDLVFPNYPATGPYDIYADPFAACGQAAVRFTLTIYEAGADGELHATFTQGGELLASSVTGGASSGLFITEKQFD